MKLLIWGCGAWTKLFLECKFIEKNDIVGMIDSFKSNEYFEDKYKIYSPHEIKDADYDMILVCVMKYKDIFNTCLETGIPLDKVYFVHNNKEFDGIDDKKTEEKLKVVKEYFPSLYGTVEQLFLKNEYDRYYLNEITYKNTAVIKDFDGHFITVWVPIELVFSRVRNFKILNIYDVPFSSLKPVINLFNFFINGSDIPYEYIDFRRKLEEDLMMPFDADELITRRQHQYNLMLNELHSNGMKFFIEHPAIGEWNNKGYFNLTDGMHRTCFLYTQGYRKVPVLISKNDFNFWLNKEKAERVEEIIEKENITSFYQPLLNPMFMHIIPRRDNSQKTRLDHLYGYYTKSKIKGKKVLDIGANIGFFGMAFARLGADVCLIEPDSSNCVLAEAVKEMMYSDVRIVNCLFEEFESDEQFDIGIMLNVMHHYLHDDAIVENFLKKINHNIKSELIWESGAEFEKEKQLIIKNTKFKNYTHLAYTYSLGFTELGVFSV